MEDKRLYVKYNEEKDFLNVKIGDEEEGMIVEVEENLFMKLSIETGEIIGYMISNYSENVHKNRNWTDKLLTVPECIENTSSFCVKREKKKIIAA